MKKGHASKVVLIAALAVTTALAGCSKSTEEGNKAKPATSAAPATPSTPTTIDLMTINYDGVVPKEDNAVLLEMQKRTNTKLNINFVPSNNYGDKFKVVLASGEIPDVILTTGISDSVTTQAIRQGAFWDLTPYLKDYPNLQKTYPKDSFENTKVDGKIYGLPRPRPLVGGAAFPALRQDWLEKLNLKMPENMEELYTVLKAFTEKDPDGNGVKDTYGLAGSVAEGYMDKLVWVSDVFAGNNNFDIFKDGKMVWRDFEPSEREAILWLQRAYKEGVLMPDFGIMKGSQAIDAMKQGKVGAIGTSMDSKNMGEWIANLKKMDPKANVAHVPTLISPATGKKYAIKEAGVFGNYLINKKVPEAKLKQILAFFDYGATPEGMELGNYGVKDVHFKVVDGVKTRTDEWKNIAAQPLTNIWTLVDPYSRIAPTADYTSELRDRDKKIIDERLQYGVFINTSGITSDTYLKVGPELGKKVQDMRMKVILGKETIEAWDKFVDAMKKDPTNIKIQEEKLASYKAIYGGK
ncbi:extracellular solute-binding protein [Paenibacillus roseipurpureus]|uniref:Extracellular solute-binding protein n=1 Tax=Paenibacillus roseopurpureus TaxID=2918901 RepID=A0AA96LT28_9BACL|nr:extracellular solute-binding protein [Paenibacillus sp. MBLB1832]WNR46016.1 extracellular solute-binding protein [Paenibacillus sp. MBLB1832]